MGSRPALDADRDWASPLLVQSLLPIATVYLPNALVDSLVALRVNWGCISHRAMV